MSATIYKFPPVMKNVPQFPNRIRELRKARKMTLEDVALAADCSIPMIGEIERGTVKLTLDWMKRIAPVLGVSTTDLLLDEDVPERMTAEEREWLDAFRAADPTQRELLMRMKDAIVPFREERQVEKAA